MFIEIIELTKLCCELKNFGPITEYTEELNTVLHPLPSPPPPAYKVIYVFVGRTTKGSGSFHRTAKRSADQEGNGRAKGKVSFRS